MRPSLPWLAWHALAMAAEQHKAGANPVRRLWLADRSGARQKLKRHTMKHIDRIIRWGGLAAVIGLVCAMSPAGKNSGTTKPFKETGLEHFVTGVLPGSFQHQFFKDARAEHGLEVWAGALLQVSQNNVGGSGSGLVMEAVYPDATAPNGVIVYAMKYEVVASGDQLAMAGTLIPQTDGTFVVHLEFLPAECTGRFAGATGTIPAAWAIPGPGYVFEGTITTVGATE
jgi:hypothetical protein